MQMHTRKKKIITTNKMPCTHAKKYNNKNKSNDDTSYMVWLAITMSTLANLDRFRIGLFEDFLWILSGHEFDIHMQKNIIISTNQNLIHDNKVLLAVI